MQDRTFLSAGHMNAPSNRLKSSSLMRLISLAASRNLAILSATMFLAVVAIGGTGVEAATYDLYP